MEIIDYAILASLVILLVLIGWFQTDDELPEHLWVIMKNDFPLEIVRTEQQAHYRIATLQEKEDVHDFPNRTRDYGMTRRIFYHAHRIPTNG